MLSAIKVYRHGVSAGVIPKASDTRGIRGECNGWSVTSSRANTRFLYSVIEDELTGYGVALTLTPRLVPESDSAWRSAIQALFDRYRRMGIVRGHWIIEWQRRGAPHLHMAVWFPDPGDQDGRARLRAILLAHWLAAGIAFDPSFQAQDAKPIDRAVGWLQYLSKHAARGQGHYQRARATLPEGWQKTGRMWGHIGDFPLQEPLKLVLEVSGWFRYRRAMRAYRKAQARLLGDYSRHPDPTRPRRVAIRYARGMLRCPNREVAHLRGLSGWVPEVVSQRLLAFYGAVFSSDEIQD